MKKYKIYLFDFDGTLLNTLPALQHVFELSYAHIGFKYDPAWTLEFSRVPLHVSYAKIGAPKEKWDEFIAYIDYSLDLPKSLLSNSPYPESLEFFQYLKDRDIFAGIVTSNNIKHVKEVFEILEIDSDIFKLFIGNKECQQFKPHPDPILKALEKLQYTGDRHDVVYVGDGINDTISANAAGVDAVLIDRDDSLPSSDKYIKIKSLMELFE